RNFTSDLRDQEKDQAASVYSGEPWTRLPIEVLRPLGQFGANREARRNFSCRQCPILGSKSDPATRKMLCHLDLTISQRSIRPQSRSERLLSGSGLCCGSLSTVRVLTPDACHQDRDRITRLYGFAMKPVRTLHDAPGVA